jgi:precorrin-6Y C5,15-methyltransferase (decarboxylating)
MATIKDEDIGSVTVVSCGMSPADLTARHREAVRNAGVLAGGRRLLDWFPEFKGERVVLGAHTSEAADQLVARSERERIAVLASGDALFFGVGRLLAARMPPGRLRVIPNVTAAQSALARLCVPWEEARFFSVHGRDEALPWRRILQAPVAVVYADAVRSPASLADELIRCWPPAALRSAAFVSDIGTPAEQCVVRPLFELKEHLGGDLTLLVLLPDETLRPALALGEEDSAYAHEAGLITHPEVRAVVLSKLRLRPGVLWDIGAGSGSVGVEAAGLCDGLAVYAVEKDEERCAHIAGNAASAGVGSVRVISGRAPDALAALPDPHSVFVGGGGADVAAIVEAAFGRLRPGGSLVAAAVMLETRARLLDCLPQHRAEIVELDVRRARPLGSGHGLEPGHPVALHVFRKEVR